MCDNKNKYIIYISFLFLVVVIFIAYLLLKYNILLLLVFFLCFLSVIFYLTDRKELSLRCQYFTDLSKPLFASFIIFSISYVFKENIYNFFIKPQLVLSKKCIIDRSKSKEIYNCKFNLKNESEKEIKNKEITIGLDVENYYFSPCDPKEKILNLEIKKISKGKTLNSCQYIINSLGPYEQINFDLSINSWEQDPLTYLSERSSF